MLGSWQNYMNNYPQIYEPMLVGTPPKNWHELLKSEKIIGTTKIDGAWYQLVKENNQVYLFSRSKSKVTGFYSEKIANVPHLAEWAMENLPNGTHLIGEIYYPGGKSNDATKIMGCLPEKAIERQEGEYGYIHYYIHDIVKYNGEDYVINQLDYSHRYSNLCKHIDIETPHIPQIKVAECYDNTYLDLEKILYQQLEAGEEGMVFRTEAGLYLPGKRRPNISFKVKEETDTIDLIITGLLEPELQYTGKQIGCWPYWQDSFGNKRMLKPNSARTDDLWMPITKSAYYGWTGSFELSAYNKNGELEKVGQVASGLTDEIKEHSANHPEKYIGRVCEVQAMSVDKDNHTLRHPRFIRMRAVDDKSPTNCKIEEIFK